MEGYAYIYDSEKYSNFKKKWLSTMLENEIRAHELKNITQACKKRNINLCLLKGIYLIDNVYENYGERSMCDVDIYVSKNDLESTFEVFKKLGYHEIHNSKWCANNFKYIFEKEDTDYKVPFELHTKLSYLEPEDFKWNIQDGINKEQSELAPTDQLSYLCIHAAHQHTFIFYHWLIDIELFYKKNSECIKWDRLEEIGHKLKCTRSIAASLFILDQYSDIQLPKQAIEYIENAKINYLMKRLSINFLLYPHQNMKEYLIVKHLLKEDFNQLFSYNLKWLGAKIYDYVDTRRRA